MDMGWPGLLYRAYSMVFYVYRTKGFGVGMSAWNGVYAFMSGVEGG